ncbi:MAG TPA: NUDIX hydrolase [Spirochaetota bacterium]|nr:NUDIX hydrolase [Spirochaetota bacterium]
MKKWEILDRADLISTGVFSIQRLQCRHPVNKIEHPFYLLNTPDWINVVALTDDNRFIMVRQHRLGTDECTLETPAGLINAGEEPAAAAFRELQEETGYTAADIVLLKRLSANPAILTNYIYFYLATGCRKTGGQKLDPAEDIDVELYGRDQIPDLIEKGVINHTIIVAAFSLYFSSMRVQSEG